jgi:hypothetical protein
MELIKGLQISDYDRRNIANIISEPGSSFDAKLIQLIIKADKHNLDVLRQVYPTHVKAVEFWRKGTSTTSIN